MSIKKTGKQTTLTQSPGRPMSTVPIGNRSSKLPILTPDTYRFLKAMLEPAKLDHRASHADMIRNVVLEDLGRRIDAVYNSCSN